MTQHVGPNALHVLRRDVTATVEKGVGARAERDQSALLSTVSQRCTVEDPVSYPAPKGRVTEPVFKGIGLTYARTDPHRPIGPQVEQAATYAEEASCPFALLLSREDVQW